MWARSGVLPTLYQNGVRFACVASAGVMSTGVMNTVIAAPCQTSGKSSSNVSLDELKRFHDMEAKLASIKNLKQAVEASTEEVGIFWDFKAGRAFPGREWRQAPDDIPEHVKTEILRPYTEDELKQIRDFTGIDRVASVPKGERPKLLIVIGPAGAGKSSCLKKACAMMDLDLTQFVSIDGDEFRSAHGGYNKHIKENLAVGYRGCFHWVSKNGTWSSGADSPKDTLKTAAISQRKNLVWGCTKAYKLGFVENDPNFKDYDIYVLALLVEWDEINMRGKNRSQFLGRGHAPGKKSWEKSMSDIVKLCEETKSKACLVINNTDFANPRVVYSRVGTHQDLAAESKRALDAAAGK